MNENSIKLIQTGGTIDKQYKMSDGSLYFPKSTIKDMLARGRCRVAIHYHTMPLLDSMEMTHDYRADLVLICQQAAEEHIVITHGTDTMVETAQLLAEKVNNKRIVLVGAMIPYAISGSDALFNLGSAITAVQIVQTGVYIAMNGKLFLANNVVKNRELGEFEVLGQ